MHAVERRFYMILATDTSLIPKINICGNHPLFMKYPNIFYEQAI